MLYHKLQYINFRSIYVLKLLYFSYFNYTIFSKYERQLAGLTLVWLMIIFFFIQQNKKIILCFKEFKYKNYSDNRKYYVLLFLVLVGVPGTA